MLEDLTREQKAILLVVVGVVIFFVVLVFTQGCYHAPVINKPHPATPAAQPGQQQAQGAWQPKMQICAFDPATKKPIWPGKDGKYHFLVGQKVQFGIKNQATNICEVIGANGKAVSGKGIPWLNPST